jgi:asparagine synthase (glutamine-hydrolysing)
MCGICGLWLKDQPVEPGVLVEMRDTISHRGPDGASGVLLSSSDRPPVAFGDELNGLRATPGYDVGFGHRRLAIIDLVSGDQPMSSDDGTIWLIQNGEIYNYRELRETLKARGHVFHTESDTEVILRAYEEYGTDCCAQFNGIFAFAIWDARKRHLMLARDHLGVKPMYYTEGAGHFAFGSEIKAILRSGIVQPDLDLDALGLALTFRHTPAPWTLFRGIRKLPPGSWVLVEGGQASEPHFFDSPPSAQADPHSQREWVDYLAEEIDRAVHRQMVSDVPIGLSLSSGVDSSTLLAVMDRWSSDQTKTFTIGFSGGGADEVVPARQLAGRHRAEFHSRVIGDSDYTDFLDRYMWHLEEPLGNESAPAYFFVAEMARNAGVKVLLTGQGPDELFAGYDRHVAMAFGRPLALAASPPARRIIRRLTAGKALGAKYDRFVAAASQRSLDERLLAAYTTFGKEEAGRLLAAETAAAIDWSLPLSVVRDWLARSPSGTPLERMLWIDARTFLPDNLLLAEDKMAMAASVEARVPFLDLEFSRLAEQVPGKLKLRLGSRKDVYRRACARWIGTQTSRRRKIGFANPMSEWFRGDMQRVLAPADGGNGSFLSTYARPDRVRTMLQDHQNRRHDHTRKLFFLASLERWHATFFH